MGLFGANKTTAKPSIKELTSMVERYFQRRHLDIEGHQLRSDDGLGWWLMEGSAKIYIFLVEDHRGPAIRITSPINQFPQANHEQFLQYLLEINRDLSGVTVASFQDVVLVTGQRSTIGLDQDELNDLVFSVSYVADRLDNDLMEKFGAPMYDHNKK